MEQIDTNSLPSGMKNDRFKDFGDGLPYKRAKPVKGNYIITRTRKILRPARFPASRQRRFAIGSQKIGPGLFCKSIRAIRKNDRASEIQCPVSCELAEWRGFEPPLGCPTNDLANRPLQPLEYHSGTRERPSDFCYHIIFSNACQCGVFSGKRSIERSPVAAPLFSFRKIAASSVNA